MTQTISKKIQNLYSTIASFWRRSWHCCQWRHRESLLCSRANKYFMIEIDPDGSVPLSRCCITGSVHQCAARDIETKINWTTIYNLWISIHQHSCSQWFSAHQKSNFNQCTCKSTLRKWKRSSVQSTTCSFAVYFAVLGSDNGGRCVLQIQIFR